VTVAFCTFCHPPRYVEKLHRPGVLREMVESHRYPFDEVVVIHNQCKAADYAPFDIPCRIVDLPRGDFDVLLTRAAVNPDDQRCEEITHGEGAAHWWKVHVVNHVLGAMVTDSDYIVFADCDTYIKSQPPDRTWVEEGISILEQYPQVLIVGPGDGGEAGGMGEGGRLSNGARLTQNVSQQLFICRGHQFRYDVDFDTSWDGVMDAPGGPMQEYYCMMEGRLWRYMRANNLWRAILPDRWRYWHDSYWGAE
jgi:hypothetical protein